MGRYSLGRLFAFVAVLLMAGCGELTPPAERHVDHGSSYIVRSGDTLYSISWDSGLDPRTVAAWNNIPPPYTIFPGQKILLTPPSWSHSASKDTAPSQPPSSAKASSPPPHPIRHGRISNHRSYGKNPTKSVGVKTTTKSVVEKQTSAPISRITMWRWPTQGRLVGRFDVSAGKKGIDIGGRNGQEIYSAAAGEVVYSGSGLLGYGKLIIIKHNDDYLSAYGHNSQLLVKEGDKVAAGQKIAEMGISPREGAILHFEIRKEGMPVDPLTYLPKRN